MKNPSQPETLELLLSFLPVWDVYNPRDLAYALSRMFLILTEILPGNDPEVRKLASQDWDEPVEHHDRFAAVE